MADELPIIHILKSDEVPESMRTWLAGLQNSAMLMSLEVMPDGSVVLQGLPEVDPLLVARVRRTIAQHEDVLRRLT